MLAGFKNFIVRGNVIDLAVGVMMGAAFTGVVNGLVDGLLMPLISAIFGQPDLSHVGNFKIKHRISLGSFDLGIYNGARMVGSPLTEPTYQPSNVVL